MNALKTRTRVDQDRTVVECTHCRLPVPRGLVEPDSPEQFCCVGCQTAWKIIHANGLDAFYKMADRDSFSRKPGQYASAQYLEFDQPAFHDRFAKRVNSETNEIAFVLDGIHCAACIWLIEKLPQIASGVLSVQVNWARQTARIVWSANEIRLSQIAETLHQLGYPPQPFRESQQEARRNRENRRHLSRIGIAAAAAGNNMLIAAALYLGMFSYMSIGMASILRVASCLVGLASLLGPGRVFLKGAWIALRTRTPHMDLPIALGLIVGSTAGLINTIRGTGEIYFDSLSVLIFLLLVGRWIQFRQQNRAADAIEMLYRLTPRQSRKIVDGRIVETFVDLIQPDDLLEIRCDDVLPVDAIVVEGNSKFDESILSGESLPVVKNAGDQVLAGTRNCGSSVVVRATSTGRETRLSKIVDLVEAASLEKPQVVQWANRTGGYFVAAVVALALFTFFSWFWLDASIAVDRTVALLIVACPCALAIATPLTVAVAMGRAAKHKIMIKSGDVLQSLRRPGMIWLDKTGTITEGRLEVVTCLGDQRYLKEIAALENNSSHPIARAITDFACPVSGPECKAVDVQQLPGRGISGRVNHHQIIVGSEQLIRESGIAISPHWMKISSEILSSDQAPCWVARDGDLIAVFAIGDRIRSEAVGAINELKDRGWRVGILSGDHPAIVNQVSSRLGIDPRQTLGGVTPENKLRVVLDSMKDHETVVMVGDGVNDCAALAAATVGVAVHNGAEASLAAAPVYLAKEGLDPVLRLLSISEMTGRTMFTNISISVTYNFLGASLAFAGFINPLVAAILMPISSLTVVAISLTTGSGSASQSGERGART